MKSFRVSERREVWITNEALEAIKDKDRALARAKRSGKQEDWELAKRLRNRVGRELENLKTDFLKQRQEENMGDPKKFWKEVSKIIPGKKAASGKIWLKHETGGLQIPTPQTADFINRFFTDIGPNLAKVHKDDWSYYGDTLNISIDPFLTNKDEVLKLCKDINPMKSSGMDCLSSRICKDAFMVLGDQLVHLFNSSLSQQKFPMAWKLAKVVPLFKGGDREDVGNYRPVSLLPLPGKLLEKVVHNGISKFWDDNNFLSHNQGSFRKGFSTRQPLRT